MERILQILLKNRPESYRERVKDVVQYIAEQPEQYKQLFALEERFAALVDEPEDSPEVVRLAEAAC